MYLFKYVPSYESSSDSRPTNQNQIIYQNSLPLDHTIHTSRIHFIPLDHTIHTGLCPLYHSYSTSFHTWRITWEGFIIIMLQLHHPLRHVLYISPQFIQHSYTWYKCLIQLKVYWSVYPGALRVISWIG